MMKKIAKTEIRAIVSEFLFLKYKGVPAPWEIVAQSKRFGFKCKKYANWSDVHVTENSRQLLKLVGDSLLDSEEFDLSGYGEISRIWERVQRWPKDKESFSVEPDILPEYEKISRLIDVGSKKPDVVDLVIDEFGFDSDALGLDDRWVLFLAITFHSFFHSKKRYQFLIEGDDSDKKSKATVNDFIIGAGEAIMKIYLKVGFDISANDSKDVVILFAKELGFIETPVTNERNPSGKIKALPKVWIEHYEGTPSEIVKFKYLDGVIIVKLNKAHKIFHSESELSNFLNQEEFWTLIGNSLHSHVSQIDEIQDFFDTFSKQIRLRG